MNPQTHITTVSSRRWDVDDTYEVIEVQVFDLPARTPVRVTVEPLSQEEYNSYLEGKTDANGRERTESKARGNGRRNCKKAR